MRVADGIWPADPSVPSLAPSLSPLRAGPVRMWLFGVFSVQSHTYLWNEQNVYDRYKTWAAWALGF